MNINLHEFLQSGAIVALSPSEVALGWGASWRDDRVVDGELCWWVQPFFKEHQTTERSWVRFANTACMSRSDLVSLLSRHPTEEASVSTAWSSLDRPVYERTFHETQSKLERRELQKLVLYTESRSPWDMRRRASVLRAALQHDSLLAFGFWQPSWGWMGATPETLFHYLSPTTVVIDAMAGTVTKSEQERLLREPKLRHEQQVVVDDIASSVRLLGTVEEEPVEVYENETLAHRHTRLTLRGHKPLSWEALINSLHPTAAVGGSPRALAHAALRALDRVIPRHMYGAPIGVRIDPGAGRCLVGLRGVYFSEEAREACILVGGGVSADSKLEEEWEELLLKFEAIRRCLNL